MSATTKLTVESIKSVSDEEPLKDLLPFIISRDKLETSAVKAQIPSVAPTLPKTMLLGALRAPQLRVIEPFIITFERENDDIVAYCEELEEFGFGTHLTEAIEDLQVAIAEVYFTLKQEKDRLGSHLSALLDTYYKKIKEVS